MNNKYFYLIKGLMLYPYKCPAKEYFPIIQEDWDLLIEILIRNRLLAYLYHFIFCKKCQVFIPHGSLNYIKRVYYAGLTMSFRYEKLRMQVNHYLKKHSLALVILKDTTFDSLKKYYPNYYYQLKFDLDLWGKRESLTTFKKIAGKMNYSGYQIRYNNESLEQFEFVLNKKNPPANLPNIENLGIELRLQIITAPILPEKIRKSLDRDIWKTIKLHKRGLTKLDVNEAFFIRALIFFIDDRSQGMKSLFDFWLYLKHKELNWDYLSVKIKKYKLINIFNFIILLTTMTFGNPVKDKPYQASSPSLSVLLALKLIKAYPCAYKPFFPHEFSDKKVGIKEKYIYGLVNVLLFDISFVHKVKFFLYHTTRFFWHLFYSLLNKS